MHASALPRGDTLHPKDSIPMAINIQRTTHDRRTGETKPAVRTTEFVLYLAAVAAVAITAFVIDADAGGGDGDPFDATQALRYITFLTIGYMLARGLAKSGSRDFHDEDDR